MSLIVRASVRALRTGLTGGRFDSTVTEGFHIPISPRREDTGLYVMTYLPSPKNRTDRAQKEKMRQRSWLFFAVDARHTSLNTLGRPNILVSRSLLSYTC